MARILIIVGAALVLLGVIWPLFGHMPGDLEWHRGIGRVYIPLGSSILISAYITAVLIGGFWFWWR